MGGIEPSCDNDDDVVMPIPVPICVNLDGDKSMWLWNQFLKLKLARFCLLSEPLFLRFCGTISWEGTNTKDTLKAVTCTQLQKVKNLADISTTKQLSFWGLHGEGVNFVGHKC